MFSNKITTPLVGDIPDSFFSNITGSAIDGDTTFLSTLRALIYPRMEEGDSLHFDYRYASLNSTSLENWSTAECLRYLIGSYYDTEHRLTIQLLNSSDNINKANMDLLKKSFASQYEGWHLIDKVSAFFNKEFNVLCFVNPSLKSTYIIMDSCAIRHIHYLQCAILAFLPWYFDREKGVSEIEKALIESLRNRSSSKYEEIIDTIARQYNFRTAKIKKYLDGFENVYERSKIEELKSSIARIESDINNYSSIIGDLLRQKNESDITLLGLKMRVAESSGESEIMSYFLRNQKLDLVSVRNTILKFSVYDYLTYFDEEQAKVMIGNKRSLLYTDRAIKNLTEEGVEKLATAIFVDQLLRVRICASYELDVNHKSVSGLRAYAFPPIYESYLPNPHIQHHSCLGDYRYHILDYLKTNEYIGAIEQCAASAVSLNLGDSVVMEEFVRDLFESSRKCIELPDGTLVSARKAVEFLNQQEVEHNG